MQFVFFMTLPGLVVLLTVLAFVDQLPMRAGRAGALPWRNAGRRGQIAATGFEQLHAALSVDLTAGTAVIRIPGDRKTHRRTHP
ncbi:hypothetical protein [Streptomyces sasae]|uniref:hypothetical protein n=1 Tax=Streptomyces sasae TaxID=1266772 RepID=UPI002930AAE2|nr:hypothetical protein [Streptomyces sasae]